MLKSAQKLLKSSVFYVVKWFYCGFVNKYDEKKNNNVKMSTDLSEVDILIRRQKHERQKHKWETNPIILYHISFTYTFAVSYKIYGQYICTGGNLKFVFS